MARREVTGKKPGDPIKQNVQEEEVSEDEAEDDPSPPPSQAYTIKQFCTAFGISEDFFYKLRRQGEGPRLMKVGTRTLISIAAADQWRREREATTNPEIVI